MARKHECTAEFSPIGQVFNNHLLCTHYCAGYQKVVISETEDSSLVWGDTHKTKITQGNIKL
jgi:hypothetical protein